MPVNFVHVWRLRSAEHERRAVLRAQPADDDAVGSVQRRRQLAELPELIAARSSPRVVLYVVPLTFVPYVAATARACIQSGARRILRLAGSLRRRRALEVVRAVECVAAALVVEQRR